MTENKITAHRGINGNVSQCPHSLQFQSYGVQQKIILVLLLLHFTPFKVFSTQIKKWNGAVKKHYPFTKLTLFTIGVFLTILNKIEYDALKVSTQ